MKWEQGREKIDGLLSQHEVQRVNPSREHADRLIGQARQHLKSALSLKNGDPEGAYALVYDAARKALAAELVNQGLRATSKGGHIATYQAVRAQLDPPLGGKIVPFDRMRRMRRDAEYPPADIPGLTSDDVAEDCEKARAIVELVEQILDEMSPY